MDFFELIRDRRSVRSYRGTKLDPSKIALIMEAVRAAPSAGNLQSYRVAVVEEPKLKNGLVQAAGGQQFLGSAPALLVFFADLERSAARYGDRGRALFAIQDATVAAAYAQLAVAALGLAACWVGAFSDDDVARVLAAPPGFRPVAMLSIGNAAEAPRRPARRRIEALFKHGRLKP
ncbi:nitroreductase family protein [Dongia sedimenti]|uniref:Nitroreductase family protein n=1 Tax=Dongia sedimenti TaxID=3064282 RepID=A0ABU0YS03_9PROT|nr:nitroreductase family protein [Rhodospirillaceae bacterium R-7]